MSESLKPHELLTNSLKEKFPEARYELDIVDNPSVPIFMEIYSKDMCIYIEYREDKFGISIVVGSDFLADEGFQNWQDAGKRILQYLQEEV